MGKIFIWKKASDLWVGRISFIVFTAKLEISAAKWIYYRCPGTARWGYGHFRIQRLYDIQINININIKH
jgi:hypothetical protein